MKLDEAKKILKDEGYIIESPKDLDEGVLTIAAGVALGALALKVFGKVLGVGLKGLANVLTQANHQAILNVIDRDKAIISAELKEYMMTDESIAELIENKSITEKQIKDWIEKSSNKLIQPEFKANGLRMANSDLHDRQLRARGWKGGLQDARLQGHFDNWEKISEISSKLAKVVYDAIYEVQNESTIVEAMHDDEVPESYFESVYDAISVVIGGEFDKFVSENSDMIQSYLYDGWTNGTSPSEVADEILEDLY